MADNTFQTNPSDSQTRLSDLRVGQTARICADRLDDGDAAMLRAMGLRPNASIRLCRKGEPCIVRIAGRHGCSCRIGLVRPLAERVLVTPVN